MMVERRALRTHLFDKSHTGPQSGIASTYPGGKTASGEHMNSGELTGRGHMLVIVDNGQVFSARTRRVRGRPVAAGVAQQVRVGLEFKAGRGRSALDHPRKAGCGERGAAPADEDEGRRRA
jgi:hypothetical protein